MKLIKDASHEKLNGRFYTPELIADFILKWAINENEGYDILEPGCGDGVFLRRIKENGFKYNSVTGVELDENEAMKSANINLTNTTIINAEFHAYCNSTKDRFDLAVGNPPFIRYQYFDKTQQIEAEKIFSRAGLKYSKLTNCWVSFIVGASLLLKEHGKIGFIVPAAILQVTYASQLRNFLSTFYNKIVIISFKNLIFPDVQQEVVLLFCEKTNNGSHLIEHVELDNSDQLNTLDLMQLKSPHKRIDFATNKWTFYFLDQKEIDFIENLQKKKQIQNLGRYAKVNVGMTTGSNKFFTVPLWLVEKYDLMEYAKPMVGRSVQIPSSIFTIEDWNNNIESGARAFFLKLPSIKTLKSNEKALEYLQRGKHQDVHKYYKTRIREEWQIVPSVRVSPALFQRRNNIYPKLVINQAKAHTTDTMHRVYVNTNFDLNGLVASYYNSLSLAFTEICGRSHGGGALELMPNEVERILLPYREENSKLLGRIDKMMRNGETIEEILNYTDPIILEKGCGFSESEIRLVNGVWKKLMTRRLNRGKNK